jgi:hypothetical protein
MVGMQSVDRAYSMRAFRMDDRKQRLFIDRAIEPGTQVFGGESGENRRYARPSGAETSVVATH